MACEPNTLTANAKCFTCFSDKQLLAMQVYQLAIVAGVEPDPETLADAAKCFMCLSEKQLLAMQVYLLCQILNP